jgi:hypothetical protein
MRIISIILVSAVVGILVGGALAYVGAVAEANIASSPPVAAAQEETKPPPRTEEKVARIEIDNPNFEFGSMQAGTKKSHTFAVRNVGKAPLSIRVGQTSCTCTVGAVTDKPIPPGESGEVRLEWTARGGSGPFQQTATVHTNDPYQSQLELSVRGEVTEAQGVEPRDFAFDKLAVGESKTAVVHVMAMLQDELTVSNPTFTDPLTADKFDVKIEPVDMATLPDSKAKAAVRITLTAKPGLPIGRIHQALALKTNLPDAEHLEIPVVGQVVGEISVHGNDWNSESGDLMLGKVKSSEGRRSKLNVVVRGADAANVRFEVQSCDPPELKVTIGEPRKLKETLLHVPIEVEVPAGTRPMLRLGTAQGEAGRIVLKTTHPKIPELVLGVRFAVER